MMKKILQRKQLEFVTGGWVMPDEAVTSYFANIDQLVEGHQWLQHFMGIIPQHGWSVDVFGHSGSYPYILSSSGISEIVILRTHYAWKKFLAESQSFDFYWEQPFPSPRTLCHMAPSALYSFKYSCGPDSVICLKFDFRHIDREYSESTADKITDKNVEQRAGYLLSQYGRYASLFPHNVLLVPLGDDFRYNFEIEWTQQMENYGKLFRYINNRTEWNAHVQFGTVSDYFKEVNFRLNGNESKQLISIEGDFLPYADIYANFRPSYWTGFYTTRPFYKQLSQELEYWLRTAEILYSLGKTLVPQNMRKIVINDYSFLISSRQTLALFQHHDAITGTSKEVVMRDYGQKLHKAILDTMSIVSHVTQMLLMQHTPAERTWTSQVYPNMYRSASHEPTKSLSISVPENGRKIILFNSLSIERTEVVSVKIKYPQIKVVDSNLKDVQFQINPIFTDELSVSKTTFELLFVATLKPMSYTVYTILRVQEKEHHKLSKTSVSLSMDNDAAGSFTKSAFSFEEQNKKDIVFDSPKLRVTFSHYGHINSIYLKDSGISKDLNIDFLTYHSWIYRSGGYLFNPDTKAMPIRNQTNHFPLLSVIRGPLMSELNIIYHNYLKFSVRLYNHEKAPEALQLKVTSDVSKSLDDVELIMRIKCDIENNKLFYTDSNGFHMLKRKYVPELPVQGNYYPATSAIFIEDALLRLNVLLPHAHGVTATDNQLEIMLDRKIHNDDGRGMGEGIEDSQELSRVFWIIPESSNLKRNDIQLSPAAFWLSLSLLYPLTTLVSEYSKMDRIKNDFLFLGGSWPSEVHLVNLRSLPMMENYGSPSNNSLMILLQRHTSEASNPFLNTFIDEKVYRFLSVRVKSVERTLLTGISVSSEENNESSSPHQLLQSCKIAFL